MADMDMQVTTRTGLVLKVRPVQAGDQAALAQFFDNVTAEDRRFRFLSVVRVGQAHIAAMIDVDHEQTESFVAFDASGTTILGTAMLASDAKLEIGEVAISVRGDHKNRGIGWELLQRVEAHAKEKGIKRLISIESRANKAAIQIEQERGFNASSYDGDMTLVVLQKGLAA